MNVLADEYLKLSYHGFLAKDKSLPTGQAGFNVTVKTSFDEMRNNKSQLFKDLGTNAFSDSAITVAANRSAELQKQMEIKMLTHFKEVRQLCTPAQQPAFDTLFYKVWNRKGEDRNKIKN